MAFKPVKLQLSADKTLYLETPQELAIFVANFWNELNDLNSKLLGHLNTLSVVADIASEQSDSTFDLLKRACDVTKDMNIKTVKVVHKFVAQIVKDNGPISIKDLDTFQKKAVVVSSNQDETKQAVDITNSKNYAKSLN